MKLRVASIVGTIGVYLACSLGALAQVPQPPQSLTVTGGTSLPLQSGSALFYDNFEYSVSRSGTSALQSFLTHGWSHAKATNTGETGAYGYLYTQPDATVGSRVLVIESRPGDAPVPPGFAYGQTDHYVRLGREGGPAVVPADAWFQFWTYATPESRFSARDKTLYPCRGYYPCQSGQWSWLLMWGSRGFETTAGPDGARFLALQGETADFRGAAEYPTNATKLFQNLNATPMMPGRWYQVRLHMNLSGAQGAYEAWIRERGQTSWTKVSEWIGGRTPNFFWPLPASQQAGFAQMSLPTTVNGPGNSTVYLDDFTIASSQSGLPQ